MFLNILFKIITTNNIIMKKKSHFYFLITHDYTVENEQAGDNSFHNIKTT